MVLMRNYGYYQFNYYFIQNEKFKFRVKGFFKNNVLGTSKFKPNVIQLVASFMAARLGFISFDIKILYISLFF